MKKIIIFTSFCFFIISGLVFPQIEIKEILPDKIVYYTKEKGNIYVKLNNGLNQIFEGRIVCELINLLDKRRKIYDEKIILEPGEKEIKINFNTGEEEYGFEVMVKIFDKYNKEIVCKSEYFSVADNIWKVAIGGTTIKRPKKSPTRYIVLEEKHFFINPEGDKEMAYLLRKAYVNYYEFFAWAPDDFFELSPDCGEDEKWFSATGYYIMSKRKIKSLIESYKSQGIRCITYAQPYAVGNFTYEFLRKKPEWFLYNQYGQPVGRFNIATLEFLKEKTKKQDFTKNPRLIGLGGEQSLSLNHAIFEVPEYGIDEIIRSAKMFGWDGVRYDNGFYNVPKNGYDFWGKPISSYGDYDEITAKAVSLIRRKLWKELTSKFAIGYNDDPKTLIPIFPKAHAESCKEGQLCISEVFNRKFSLPEAKWKDMIDYIKEDVKYVHSLGGHYMVIGPYVNGHVPKGLVQSYLQVLIFALRTHTYHGHLFVYDDPELTGNYSQFMSRYSAFIWDNEKVKNIDNPEKIIEVKSEKELWWKEFVCERKDKDEYQLILHLINPPTSEIISKTQKAPEIQKNIKIVLKIPKNCTIKNVYLLTAEPKTRQEVLKFNKIEDKIGVNVPELKIWDVIVFDFKKLK